VLQINSDGKQARDLMRKEEEEEEEEEEEDVEIEGRDEFGVICSI
jgi:hypothetical protein